MIAQHHIIDTLQNSALCTAFPLLDAEATRSAAWRDFKDSWNNLRLDRNMADGSTYRYRRYATFAADGCGKPRLQPHAAHFQLLDYNKIHGDLERLFDPMETHIATNEAFQEVLSRCLKVFSACEARAGRASDWHIEVHQFRIYAQPEEHGCPTPEGVHSDGRDYVFMMLLDKQNVVGGETTVYDRHESVLFQGSLAKEADAMFLDDRSTMHGVSPIRALASGEPGYRDVLVVTFCNKRRDDSLFGRSTQKAQG